MNRDIDYVSNIDFGSLYITHNALYNNSNRIYLQFNGRTSQHDFRISIICLLDNAVKRNENKRPAIKCKKTIYKMKGSSKCKIRISDIRIIQVPK